MTVSIPAATSGAVSAGVISPWEIAISVKATTSDSVVAENKPSAHDTRGRERAGSDP
jgi:hypothetical protein